MTFTARKSLLAIAAGMTLASGAFAQTAPSVTLYGRLDVAMENTYDGANSRTMLQNFASRFGMKGDRSFNKDLSALFQVETGIAPDDTTQSKTLASRNSFVGLKSNEFGSLLLGTYDMPLKTLDGGGLASTLWAEGDAMEVIIHGKGTKTAAANSGLWDNVHTRKTNNVVYISPKFADVVVKAAFSPDEAQTPATPGSQSVYSVSAEWNNGTYNFGLATQKFGVSTGAASGKDYGMSATKMTMGAVMGDFTAGLAFSTLSNNAPTAANARQTTNSLLTLGYTMGATVFKYNTGTSSESVAGALDGLSMSSVEAVYNLDKQTAVYANYAQINNGSLAKGKFENSDNFPAPAAGQNPSALSLGIRYNF
jgi:predicted porin